MLHKNFYKNQYVYILFLLIIYTFTALNNVGFYNDDEHFQILEPVAYLLGINNILLNDPQDINWEWEVDHRIRPWFQSYLYYYLVLFLKFLNLNNPFIWAFSIKFLNGSLGIISIIYLFNTLKKYFLKNDNLENYIIFFTFWFFPFIHLRTSSESLGIILFCIALPFFYKFFINKEAYYNQILAIFFGIILGLSIVVRPQMIFTILPVFLWVLIYNYNFKKIILCCFGVSISILIGIIVDSLTWGFFTNTYFQLYKIQIVSGYMGSYSSKPWWYFITSTLLELAPVFSFFFIISLVYFIIKHPKNLFTWLTIGTYLILCLFQHKETRFIFPIYIFAPFFLIYFFGELKNTKLKIFLICTTMFFNYLFLFIVVFYPINGKVSLYKEIYYLDIKYENIYYIGENPYQMNKMIPFFYTSFLPKIEEREDLKFDLNSIILTNDFEIQNKVEKIEKCKNIYSTYPKNIVSINPNWKNKKINWYLNYCQ